jgi:snRNA-activating protein complex subunit 3
MTYSKVPLNSKSQKLSSSYLFIENIFYNDMRSPLATDYSQPIIQWVMQDGRHEENGLAPYSSKLMHQVQWLDLSLRLNYPYLLTHQGDCTHTFSIRSVR